MKSLAPGVTSTWRPLALGLFVVAALLAVVTRLTPYDQRPFNFAVAGALFLFAGARVRPWSLYLLPFAVMAGVDLYFLRTMHYPPSVWVYLSYALYLIFAVAFLRHTESPWRIGTVAFAGSVQFFIITNFGVWLQSAMGPTVQIGTPGYYPTTWAGLLDCYTMALPFFRGTWIGDLLFSGALFGAYALLSRSYFPSEKIVPVSSEVLS